VAAQIGHRIEEGDTAGMSDLRFSESIFVARPPEFVYDMVADVTRMGEWSPVCKACWWEEGDGPAEGAWFTGRNELPQRTWETRSLVVAADRGKEFAFQVNGYGDDAENQIEIRERGARHGIPVTLAAIKQAAEAP
jgi:hypothetical protein